MKNLLIVIVFLVCGLGGKAFAGGFATLDTIPSSPRAGVAFKVGAEKEVAGSVNLGAFAQVTSGWAQAYVGPTLAVADWVTLGVSAGVEQSDGKLALRYAATAFLAHGPLSFFCVVEGNNTFRRGLDELWYEGMALWRPLSYLAVGVRDRRSVGFGPALDLRLGASGFHVYGAWMPFGAETGVLQPKAGVVGITTDL